MQLIGLLSASFLGGTNVCVSRICNFASKASNQAPYIPTVLGRISKKTTARYIGRRFCFLSIALLHLVQGNDITLGIVNPSAVHWAVADNAALIGAFWQIIHILLDTFGF